VGRKTSPLMVTAAGKQTPFRRPRVPWVIPHGVVVLVHVGEPITRLRGAQIRSLVERVVVVAAALPQLMRSLQVTRVEIPGYRDQVVVEQVEQ